MGHSPWGHKELDTTEHAHTTTTPNLPAPPTPPPTLPSCSEQITGFYFLLSYLSSGPQNRIPFGQGLLTLPGEEKLGQVNHC